MQELEDLKNRISILEEMIERQGQRIVIIDAKIDETQLEKIFISALEKLHIK